MTRRDLPEDVHEALSYWLVVLGVAAIVAVAVYVVIG